MTSLTVKIVVLARIMGWLPRMEADPSTARSGTCRDDRVEELVDEAARDRGVAHQQAVEERSEDEIERQVDVGRRDDQALGNAAFEHQAGGVAIARDEFVAE